MMDERFSIAIVGAGAVGQLLGGRLALAGHRVTLVARERAAPGLRGDGVRLLRHDGKQETARVDVATVLDGSVSWDYVVVAVRAEQLVDVLASVRNSGARGRALVIATAIWGPDPSFRSDHFADVLVLSPGFIAGEQGGQLRYRMTRTAVGPLEGAVTAASRKLVTALTAAGVPARVRANVAYSYAAALAIGLPWALAIEASGFDLSALARDRTRRSAATRAARESVALVRKRSGQIGPGARVAAAISGAVVAIGGPLAAPLTKRGWGKVAWDHLRKIAAQDRAMLDELYRWGAAHGEASPALGALVASSTAST